MHSPHGIEVVESCAGCQFRSHSIFSDLSPESLKKLDTALHRNIYPRGAILYFEEDDPRGIYCLCAGRVKLTRSTDDGKTIILRIAEPGDILGAEAIVSGSRHGATAEAMEPCQVKYLRREEFLQLLKENGTACFRVAQKMSDALCQSYAQIRDMGCKVSAMERLAALLLRLVSSYGEKTALGIRLKLKLRREELAEMIGASRETASRLLTELKKEGVIKTNGRTIVILDKPALENHLSS